MKSIYVFLLITVTFYMAHSGWFYETARVDAMPSGAKQGDAVHTQDNGPKVEVTIAGAPGHLTWNTQVRYSISVTDPKDGESRFGEIDPRACLMEIEYFPAADKLKVDEVIKSREEHKGLSLLKRSTCFGCHADKSRLAGPSFAEIADRYENNAATVNELASHVMGGSTGIWGSQMMPSHPDLTLDQAGQIVEYILAQGKNKNRWVYPGLEGTFRTVEKENHEHGVYVLTASYTSTSNIRGDQTIVIKIK